MSSEAPPHDAAIARAESRIRRLIALAGLIIIAVAYAKAGGRGAVGAGIGVALSLINYAWLKAGVNALEPLGDDPAAAMGAHRAAGAGMTRFAARLILLAVCLYAIFISHLVPIVATVIGLLAAPFGVLAAAILEVFGLLSRKSEP